MKGHIADIQVAIYGALINDSNLAGLLADNVEIPYTPAIYDHVPQPLDGSNNIDFPYITIGDDTNLAWDTDTEFGLESTITIHSWSRHRGRLQVKQIQDAVYESLHDKDLVVNDSHTVLCLYEFSESFLDSDGLTRHGVQRFRVIVEDEDTTT